MKTLALVPSLALAAAALAGCPEQRPVPRGESRPPQAAISAGDAGSPDILSLRRPAGPEWFGLYLAGKKAGWARAELVRELRDGKDVLIARETTFLKVERAGSALERSQEEERIFEARPGGRLLSFTSVMKGDGDDRTLRGTCPARDRCTVRIEAPGREAVERSLEVTETTEQADPARLAAARRGAVRGHNVETLRVRVREQEDVFVGREKMARPGVELEVSVVAEQEVGDRAALEYRIADDGRVMEARQGALVLLPEPEDRARQLEVVDIAALGRVALPRPLPYDVPAAITYQLTGLPRPFWLNSERQRFEATTGEAVRLTVTARLPLATDPAKDTPLAQAARGADPRTLESTGAVDADAPEIVALARQVAGDAPGAYAAARRLNDHVHGLVATTMSRSHDRASDVLRARNGDCSEHALLTVALARALKIPAREVYGLVYSGMGGVDGLYWHDWVEIRSGGEWIALDPTFGQPVADATHIALSGSERNEAIGLIAALKVTGVEVRDVPPPRPAGGKKK